MTPQELKNSILLYAVQGKLSKQDGREKVSIPNDCWSNNEEEPFSIPPNWIWKRFGFFAELRMGKTILKAQLCDKGIPVYSATQSDDVLGHIQSVELELHRNDLVIPARGNSIGFVTLVKDEIATCTQTTICAKDLHDILPEYLYYCCYAFKKIWFVFSGSAIPQVTVKQIEQFMVPTPPLSEQKRIVAKIEELLPLIDRYEKAWSRLEEFNKRFPDDMQKSILQMAIQGKLVEQQPEEGTGEELYRQIQAEKQKLIKEGKIKKEKPLPEIAEEEKPFDIPESWKWVHFSDVMDVRDGTHDTPKYVTDGIPLVTSKNLIDGRIDFETTKLISYTDAKAINLRSAVDDGDILFAMIGTIGNPVLVKKDRVFCIKNMALFKNISHELLYMPYVLRILQKEQSNMKKIASGGVQSFVSLRFLREYLLPLPPILEQKRIVDKLEALLPICKRLER